MPDNKKLVSIQGKKEEEEIYIHPDALTALSDAAEWVKLVGCSEIQITLTSGCMSFSEVFDTQERTEAGLGAIERYKQRYARELDADWWEED